MLREYLLEEYTEEEVADQVNNCTIEFVDANKKLFKITYDNGNHEFVEVMYKPYFSNENTEHM